MQSKCSMFPEKVKKKSTLPLLALVVALPFSYQIMVGLSECTSEMN